jgi:hypothetical protein
MGLRSEAGGDSRGTRRPARKGIGYGRERAFQAIDPGRVLAFHPVVPRSVRRDAAISEATEKEMGIDAATVSELIGDLERMAEDILEVGDNSLAKP